MTADNVIPLPRTSGSPKPPREERDWVTGIELAQEAGITYRQLDYWTRTDLLHTITVPDPGSGYLRAYSEHELTRATAIKHLLDAGVSLQIIRAHLDEFVTTGRLELGPITIARTPQHNPANQSGETTA